MQSRRMSSSYYDSCRADDDSVVLVVVVVLVMVDATVNKKKLPRILPVLVVGVVPAAAVADADAFGAATSSPSLVVVPVAGVVPAAAAAAAASPVAVFVVDGSIPRVSYWPSWHHVSCNSDDTAGADVFVFYY